MTAITFRKPARPLQVMMTAGNAILLPVAGDAVHDGTPEKGRKLRNVLRALVAYKQGKKR